MNLNLMQYLPEFLGGTPAEETPAPVVEAAPPIAPIVQAAQDVMQSAPQQQQPQEEVGFFGSVLNTLSDPTTQLALSRFGAAMGGDSERYREVSNAYTQRLADIESRKQATIAQQEQRKYAEKQGMIQQLYSRFTPESVYAYQQSGDQSVLVPLPVAAQFRQEKDAAGNTYEVQVDPTTGMDVEGGIRRQVGYAAPRAATSSQDWTISGGYRYNKRTGEYEYIGKGGEGPESEGEGVQLADGSVATAPGMYSVDGQLMKVERSANGNLTAKMATKSEVEQYSLAMAKPNPQLAADMETVATGLSTPGLRVGAVTGVTGSIGKPAVGADVLTRTIDTDVRDFYTAATRLNAQMENMGIADAKAMGASGINTTAEFERFSKGMPRLDFSGEKALRDSHNRIQEYIQRWNERADARAKPRSGETPMFNQAPQQATPQVPPQGTPMRSKGGVSFTVR